MVKLVDTWGSKLHEIFRSHVSSSLTGGRVHKYLFRSHRFLKTVALKNIFLVESGPNSFSSDQISELAQKYGKHGLEDLI